MREEGPVASTTNAGYDGRLLAARQMLESERLEAVLVFDLLNVRHLCGFTGSNGLLLVGESGAWFFTDSRYTLQARSETRGVEVVEAADLDAAAATAIDAAGARYVGYQAASLTAARRDRLTRLTDAHLVGVETAVDALRVSKDAGELKRLREAAHLAEDALRSVAELMRPGNREAEIARAFHVACLERGAEGLSFETIVAGGERGALPHAKPTDRRFRDGELVVVDFGVRWEGYCSDETVMVPVGDVTEEARGVYEVVLQAQRAALQALRPGVALRDVDRAARDVIRAAGHGEHFGHGTGHGVGLAVHEAPTVNTRSRDVAREGMVVTVEPGIYLAGRFGVRLEDTVVVSETGWEPVTTLPKAFGATFTGG